MRVLLVDGSSGQSHGAVGAVRALANAGHEVDVAHAEPLALAAWSRHRARKMRIPSTEDPRFAEVVRTLLEHGRYDACLPSSDAAMVALDWPGAELVDKRVVRERWARAGGPATKSWEFASGVDLLDRAAELPSFPVAVKSAVKSGPGASGVFRADSVTDLEAVAQARQPVFVEEWLSGVQVAVTGIISQGRLLAVTHQRYLRTWPVECGIACAAVTTEPDLELEELVANLLGDHEGIFQCQLIDGRLHDVNPRVFGSLLLAYRAGVNLPHLAVTLAAGQLAANDAPVRGRPGFHYRWVEGDLRHLKQVRGRSEVASSDLARALRPVRHTIHPDVWLSDPVPTAARLLYAGRQRRRVSWTPR